MAPHSFTRFPLLTLLFTMFLLAACERDVTTYVQDAKQDISKGDVRAAILNLKNALAQEPNHAEARLLIGGLYNDTQQYATAEKEIRKAVELGIGKDPAQVELARALVGQRQFEKVLELDPHDGLSPPSQARLLAAQATANLGLSRTAQAEALLASAAETYANLPEVQLANARLRFAQHQPEVALRLVEESLAQSPKALEALNYKAALLHHMGQMDGAITVLREILKLRPNDASPHLQIASMLLIKDQYKAALNEVEAAEKKSAQHPMVHYMKALVLYRQNEFKRANEAIQQTLRLAPAFTQGVLLRGAISFSLGHFEGAAQDFSRVLFQTPQHAYARYMLAASEIRLNQFKKSLDTLNPLLTAPNPPTQSLALAGEAWMKLRDFEKATAYLERAATALPDNRMIKTGLAISHMGAGETEKGLAELETLMKGNSEQSQAGVLLVLTRLQRKEFDLALRAVDDMIQHSANNPTLLNLRGAAYLGKRDVLKARQSFEQALAARPGFFPAAANLAQMDLAEKNPEAARKRFEGILAQDKAHLKAMLALAELAALNRQDAEYKSWLERATKTHPESIQARQLLIGYYLKKKDNKSALRYAQDAVSANPNSSDALGLLGATQLSSGDAQAAVNTYGKLTKVHKEPANAYRLLGMAHMAAKDFSKGRAAMKEAIRLKPADVENHNALFALEMTEGNTAAAERVARDMQAQFPKLAIGYWREGDVHVRLKAYDRASASYERAQHIQAQSPLMMLIHRTMTLSGRGQQGDQKIREWLIKYPKDLIVRNYYAEHLLRDKRIAEAAKEYEHMLSMDANNVAALNNLAYTYHLMKDTRARAFAEKALRLAPDSANVMDTLGWILVDAGQLPAALDWLSKAVAKAPGDPEMRYHYAVALHRSGDNAKAKRELKAALSKDAFPSRAEAEALHKKLP